MNKTEFAKKLIRKAEAIGIKIDDEICDQFYKYMQILLEWNEKINLTAITEINDIIDKHFIDSLTINKYIKENAKLADIGTGAGFPGMPLKILNKEKEFILIDSLNKRINFLEEVKKELKFSKLDLIHGRAEELARNKGYRENIDVVVSRAVANLSTLLEYMLPFVKVGGKCICMKGPNIKEEVNEAQKAIKLLGGELVDIEKITIPETTIERNIIIIKKIKRTPKEYPRKPGTPTKKPIK